MHGRTHPHFDRFQVELPGLAPAAEQDLEPLVYFAGDLLIDRSSRFFSSGVQRSLSDARGRCRQIFSLTASSSVFSVWKRWYSSISDCALRRAAGVGNDSAMVFPSTVRVSRICGSCPPSLGLAQIAEGGEL